MPVPPKSMYIIAGEMNMVVTAMRKGNRWISSHVHQEEEQDGLFRNFSNLKEILNHVMKLSDIEPSVFLTPFLDVIRSEDTTGPVTALALSSINKFLSYGLVDPNCEGAVSAVENIADAVTHARFVGTDPASDEVVLMKILQVLRTLLLTPVGILLTNESVCEIMQSCFRICFEMRLSELLRKSAELTLMDMVQLLFCRLPQFSDDTRWTAMKKLKMRAGGMDTSRTNKKRRSPRPKHRKPSVPSSKLDDAAQSPESLPPSTSMNSSSTSPIRSSPSCEDVSAKESDARSKNEEDSCNSDAVAQSPVSERDSGMASLESVDTAALGYSNNTVDFHQIGNSSDHKPCDACDGLSDVGSVSAEIADDTESVVSGVDGAESIQDSEYINPRGVRFMPQQETQEGPLIPYGLPSVRELFRFLISLINPLDRHNTDTMIQIGLSLLTVALESGADHIGKLNSLLTLVKDDMCRYLFSLLNSERISVFAATLRICFLLFESLRSQLKFQLELYLSRLMEIVVSESSKLSYEQREVALDSLVQLWRIPGFVTELYLNYDCDLYCSNLFEDLIKLLSKNAFPVSGLYSTHLLSLDALLTVIESIENHCHTRILNETQVCKALSTNQESTLTAPSASSQKPTNVVPSLSSSGYLLGQQILQDSGIPVSGGSSCDLPTENTPTREELSHIKLKKKLYATGTEKFNQKPYVGIAFLQEHKLLQDPLDPEEVAAFLRNNPRLDKKMIGEYISNRKNLRVLEAFVKSFNFEDTRIDEALRTYLETFRLPGEAPLISLLMEHFAEHWHKSNGELFANNDAAFTLSYAIIMLNVDQHNNNVKKQNNPMTVEDFKKNLKNVNGGQDFDQEMLEEIYTSIKNEEIVMPAEQTGLVRENYLWKVLLRRGASKEGVFLHASDGFLDHELFTIIWGPTVAALSFVFDKSLDGTIIQKAIAGFRKCAMISAYYGMSDVFDNLVISLCKFTILLSATETPESLPVSFGSNTKAQLAAKTVFNLAHRHGDILREGWKNLLDCTLQLYRAKLLPTEMVEAEDFVNPNGYVSLIREKIPNLPRTESGLFSSFYSYITLTPDPQQQKGISPEDEAASQAALNCIADCHPEQLITESKFLRLDSLQELVKALIYASHGPDSHASVSDTGGYDEDSTIFLLELLLKIVLQNRDRVLTIWPGVRDHLYSLVMGASACDHQFLLERSVTGILRLAIRMLRREEMASQALQCVRMLLILKPQTLQQVSLHISYALFELLRTNAGNIRSSQDWTAVFSLLACVGAGAKPPRALSSLLPGWVEESSDSGLDTGAQSDSELSTGHHGTERVAKDRGYTSDSELYEAQASANSPRHTMQRSNQNTEMNSSDSWISVGKEGSTECLKPLMTPHQNQYSIVLNSVLQPHNPQAYMKCCETLAFLIRDAAYITSENFESCIHCLRTFTEASVQGSCSAVRRSKGGKDFREKRSAKAAMKRREEQLVKRSYSSPGPRSRGDQNSTTDDDKEDDLPAGYHQVVIQLLDLMHTLHTKASSIFDSRGVAAKFQPCGEPAGSRSSSLTLPNVQQHADVENGIAEQRDEDSAKDSSLWSQCWCPLLQGIAYSCCDARRSVRTAALTYLQRALLVHDLQILTAAEWESCFNKVLFPLLSKLLEDINLQDPVGVEETRMRAATLLCKVFLQHLNPLLTLPTFTALWLTILDFMDKYMHADGSDLLNEAIPESLKNMLLVMDTAGIFSRPDDEGGTDVNSSECQLWNITWDRINTFLPQLKDELFKPPPPPIPMATTASPPVTQVPEKCRSAEEHGDTSASKMATTPPTSTDAGFDHSAQQQTVPSLVPTWQSSPPRKDSFEERSPSHHSSFVVPTSSQILTTSTVADNPIPLAPAVILHPPATPVAKPTPFPISAAQGTVVSQCSVAFSTTHSTYTVMDTMACSGQSKNANPVPLLLNPFVVGQTQLNINQQGVPIKFPNEVSCNPPQS